MKRLLKVVVIAGVAVVAAVAQPQINDGVNLYNQSKYKEAASFFRQVLTSYPRDAQSWLYLSRSYVGAGNADSAEIAGRKAVSYDDENPEAYAVLSHALTLKKNFAEANIVLRRGLKEKKDHPSLLIALGALQLASDSANAALVTFTRAREVAPKNAKAYEGMGDAYAMEGVYPMAVGQYEKSLEIDSMQVKLLEKLGELHMKNRAYSAAVLVFERLLAMDPNNMTVKRKLATIYYRAKMWGKAWRLLKEYTVKFPTDTLAWKYYSESLYNGRQYKDVSAAVDKVLTLDPSYRGATRMKAHSLFVTKEYKKSVDLYRSAPASDSLEAEDYWRLGRAYIELGQDTSAIGAFERSLRMDSTQSAVINDFATVLMKLKRWEYAAHMFQMRFALDSSASSLINYAQCMIQLEKYEEASRALELAISLAPDYVPAYTRLGIAHVQIQLASKSPNYDRAQTIFEKSIAVIDTQVYKYKSELAQAYRYMGLIGLLQKKWEIAITWLTRSLDLEPKDENTLLWKAQGLQNSQKKDKAKEAYKEVLKINPKNAQAIAGLKTLEGIE